MNSIRNNSNIAFTARCPQIRDAQWVCHTVCSALPHFSTTKYAPGFQKYIENSSYLDYPKLQGRHLVNIHSLLMDRILSPKDVKNCPFKQRVFENLKLLFMSKSDKRQIKILDKIRQAIINLVESRNKVSSINSGHKRAIAMLEGKLGNCQENAFTAEVILKINGINNAKSVALTQNNNTLDHAACVFNKDGSSFDGRIMKGNTIIIDPWFGKADFADNMFIFYKNNAGRYFDLNPNSKFGLKVLDSRSELDDVDAEILRYKYPQFVFPNKTRKFMSK